MSRYIDADNFRKTMIKRFGCIPCLTDYSEASRNDIPIDDALNLAPTADVVPKSEVEKQKLEIWRLQGEVERLRKALDEYEETSGLKRAKAEVAKEIFEEIDSLRKEGGVIWTNYASAVLAELKKKYQEGEL